MSRMKVGTAIADNTRLEYFIIKEEHEAGYKVSVEKMEYEEATVPVPCGKKRAIAFVQALKRNTVFPSTLSEVVQEYDFFAN